MPYLSSTARLPHNSQDPPNPCKVARANRRLQRDACQTAEGRNRAYVTVANAGSMFTPGGLGLVKNAGTILDQTKLSRASSVTTGIPITDTKAVLPSDMGAPQVVPLNARQSTLCPDGSRGASIEEIARPRMVTMMPIPFKGLAGYGPRWGDAAMMPELLPASSNGFLDWIRANPWLALAIVGGGIAVITHQQKGRR